MASHDDFNTEKVVEMIVLKLYDNYKRKICLSNIVLFMASYLLCVSI